MKQFSKLKKLYKQYKYERLITRMFFDWAVRHASEGATVRIALHTIEGVWRKKDDVFVRVVANQHRNNFLVSTGVDVKENDKINRITLFKSEFLCIHEFSSVTELLRHGLSIEEKFLALQIARKNLESYLKEGEYVSENEFENHITSKYQEPATVDVTLWVEGKLRGSIIFSAPTLFHALVVGSARSARDGRFQPLEYKELGQLRIEINILSDLHIPLPDQLHLPDMIMTEKGYVVAYQGKKGWFLPSVFNITHFTGFNNFLNRLALEKAKITLDELKYASFSAFEVENFIEDADRREVRELNGPVIKNSYSVQRVNDLKNFVSPMADWLCRLQTNEGFIPQRADPYSQSTAKTDWARMAFSAFALGTYGYALGISHYQHAANKTAEYIGSVIDNIATLRLEEKILVHAYLGRLALLQHRETETEFYAEKIQELMQEKNEKALSVITSLQAASFLRESDERIGGANGQAKRIVKSVMQMWENSLSHNNSEEISFAAYAELLPNLFFFSRGEEPELWLSTGYEKLRNWYLSHQLQSGAFPNTTESAFTYTRGTGKICEVLAVDPENIAPCLRGLEWIIQFQYQEDSLFNISPDFQEKIRGSVMHDSIDHTAWVDSVGHVLVCTAYLLAQCPDPAEEGASL